MAVAKLWNGSAWVRAIVGAKGDKGDPGITIDEGSGAADGDVLVYDANWDVWVPQQPETPGKVLAVYQDLRRTPSTFSSLASGGTVTVGSIGITATPASASSKFLIQGFLSLSADTDGAGVGIILTRDGSPITLANADGSGSRAEVHSVGFVGQDVGTNQVFSVPFHFVDSPATTLSVTYGVDILNTDNTTANFYLNRSVSDTDASRFPRSISVMTVTEISG